MTIFDKLNTVLDVEGSILMEIKQDCKLGKAGTQISLIDIDELEDSNIVLTFDFNGIDVEDEEWDQDKIETITVPGTDQFFMDNFTVISK